MLVMVGRERCVARVVYQIGGVEEGAEIVVANCGQVRRCVPLMFEMSERRVRPRWSRSRWMCCSRADAGRSVSKGGLAMRSSRAACPVWKCSGEREVS